MTELIFRDDAYLRACNAQVTAVTDGAVELDRTVFYPTGGGQPGDMGVLRLADGSEVAVIDTRKGEAPDSVLHILAPGSAVPAVGSLLEAEIDWDRRHRLMRMHSCLHLVCAVIPHPVTGGQIGDGKGRLDFDVTGEPLDREAIEVAVNRLIEGSHVVAARWITDAELADRPELVRTMSVKPPSGQGRVRLLDIAGIDLQPCGGTHIRSTAEIGAIRVVKIENKGKQNRRVALEFA